VGAVNGRFVAWQGLVNARDLGGLPLAEGGRTRAGSVFRADNIRHLTPTGWLQMSDDGVRTVIDLRFERERVEPQAPERFDVVNISLFGAHDPGEQERVDSLVRGARDTAEAVAFFYLDILETCAPRIGEAIEAVANAGPGGVVVHCFVGKDRTGIVSALLLELAGVAHEAIVADYVLSDGRVGSLVDGWIAEAETEAERTFRTRTSAAPAHAMEALLEGVRTRYGGAIEYLRATGVADDAIASAAARLR
jgi:protein-tyrosine phosphatase